MIWDPILHYFIIFSVTNVLVLTAYTIYSVLIRGKWLHRCYIMTALIWPPILLLNYFLRNCHKAIKEIIYVKFLVRNLHLCSLLSLSESCCLAVLYDAATRSIFYPLHGCYEIIEIYVQMRNLLCGNFLCELSDPFYMNNFVFRFGFSSIAQCGLVGHWLWMAEEIC